MSSAICVSPEKIFSNWSYFLSSPSLKGYHQESSFEEVSNRRIQPERNLVGWRISTRKDPTLGARFYSEDGRSLPQISSKPLIFADIHTST